MTQPALPPPPISAGTYWYLMLAKPDEKAAVIEAVGKAMADRYKMLRKTAMDAVGIHNEVPALRLRRYENGVLGLPGGTQWAALQQAFPQRYDELQKDFHRLAGKTLAGAMEPPQQMPERPPVPQVLSAGMMAA